MRILVLLFLAVSAAAAEVPLTEPVYGPAPANQYFAAVASDGTDYLAVWSDRRTVPNEAYATRITREGVILDPTGIRIPAKDVYDAQVVWTGANYLVVWREPFERLASVRISREGKLVQEPRVLLEHAQLPQMIQVGALTVIAHLGGPNWLPQPRVSFIDRDGNLVAGITLATGGVNVGAPRVAWNGSELVAVWTRGSVTDPAVQVEAVRFDVSGVQGTPRTVVATGYNVEPHLASDGRDFVLLTRDYDTSIHHSMHLAADLTPGEKFALPREIYSDASLLWTGSDYLVVADNGAHVSALRLGRDARPEGSVRTIESTVSGGMVPESEVATNGTDVLVVWSAAEDPQRPFDSLDVHGSLFAASTLQRKSTARLSTSARRQWEPIVAASPHGLLTVWNEESGLYARRMTSDGNPIDPAPLWLGLPARAAVAFNGTDYIVASIETKPQQLVTRRIAPTGELAAAIGMTLATDYVGSIVLASDNAETLLVWNTAEGVHAARLAADASLRDAVPVRLAEGVLGDLAAAGSGGGGYLVTWTSGTIVCCHGQSVPIAISGTRVTRELTSLDFGGFTISNTNAYESDPAVAWNGREWLVTWHSTFGAASDIRARRITRSGTLLDGGAADPGLLVASQAWNAKVAWDGVRYAVAWFDNPGPNELLRIYTAWMSASGVVSEPRVLGEAESYANAGAVSLAPIGTGRVATTYARIGREPIYGGVSRGFVQVLSFALKRRSVR